MQIQNFEKFFPVRLLNKGRQLLREEKMVRLIEPTSGQWEATVLGEGSEPYGVFVHINDRGEIRYYDCSCGHPDGEYCEHLALTLYQIKRERAVLKDAVALPEAGSSTSDGEGSFLSDNTSSMIARILALPENHRMVVTQMAYLMENLSVSAVGEFLSFIGCSLKKNDLETILTKLVSLGFLEKEGKSYYCSESIAREIFYHYAPKDTKFAAAQNYAKLKYPMYWWHVGELKKKVKREIFFSIVNKDISNFYRYLEVYLNGISEMTYSEEESIVDPWLPKGGTPEEWPHFPLPILHVLLILKLEHYTSHLEHYATCKYYQYALKNLKSIPREPQSALARVMCILNLLSGHWDQMKEHAAFMNESDQMGLLGTTLVLSGHTQEAIEAFKKSFKEARKTTGSAKAVPYEFWGAFYIIAIIQLRDPSQYDKLIKQIDTYESKGSKLYKKLFVYLGAYVAFLMGNSRALEKSLNYDSLFSLNEFFRLIISYWGGEGVNLVQVKRLAHNTKQDGYTWIWEELTLMQLAVANEPPHTFTSKTGSRHDVPMYRLVARVEAWENTLDMLQQLAAVASEGKPKQSESRLVWMVDFDRMQIQPKEQTYGKKGWLLGRNVGHARLLSGDMNCLTEQDRRIAVYYTKLVSQGYWYAQHADNTELWESLVGHPLLFLEKSPQTGVQFELGKPTLYAEKVAGGYALRMSPDLSAEGPIILKESPTRYRLIEVNEKHRKMHQALQNNTLIIPQRGEKRLQEVVGNLVGVIDVQSALVAADENLPLVQADARICVHILPVGNGFHLELYTKPFGDTPPYCKPGMGEPMLIALVNGERVRTERNLKAENKEVKKLKEAVETLRDLKPAKDVWILEDAQQCLSVLLQLDPLLREGLIVLEWPKGEKYKIERVAGFDDFKMRISSRNNWFEVQGSLQIDEDQVLTMQELLALSNQQKSNFVELSPGKFLALTEEFRRRLQEVDALLSSKKNGSLQFHPLAIDALSPFVDALHKVEFDKKFKENRSRLQQAFAENHEPPAALKAELRPYQRDGYEWLMRRAKADVGACLADDMGLGKTIQALGLLISRASTGAALVVAPASVCRNWLSETIKFAPSLNPILFGEGDRAAIIEQAGAGDLLIVTYDLMTRAADQFVAKQFGTIILDEAQSIKNRSTKRSETAMQLQADFKLIMTGTPLENHLGELWNLFQFINPGLMGSIDDFNDRFAVPIEKYRDDNRRDQLRRLVHPFILRRRKNDVLKDLPEKTEITLTVELSAEEKSFYEALRRQALAKLAEDKDSGAGEKHLKILAEIMRLRRAACHPKLADPNTKIANSAKIQLFADLIEELRENGHKALIFSQFVAHLELLREVLDRLKVPYQYLDGQTPLNTRQKRIEAFQAGEGDCFLISLKAGGVGLNLTAADYVIHMDPWWNPAVEDQATDRAHRIGQDKPVTVYRLVAEGTIEEKILKLHEQKRDLADSLLSGADVSAKLSADELLAMIAESSV